MRVVHLASDTTELPRKLGLTVRPSLTGSTFSTSKTSSTVSVSTDSMRAEVDIATGSVTLFDSQTGTNVLLQETSTSFSPVTDTPTARKTYTVKQTWASPDDEGLWGGGQYQNGLINWKSAPLNLVQFNTEAVVPFFVSSKGYGLLWDIYSWSFLNDAGIGGDEGQRLTKLVFSSTPTTVSGFRDVDVTGKAVGAPGEAGCPQRRSVLDGKSSSSLSSLPEGTAIVMLTSGTADPNGQDVWVYNATSLRLSLKADPGMVLDANVHSGSPHLWEASDEFGYNQQWVWTSSNQFQLKTPYKGQTLCLKANGFTAGASISAQPCDVTSPNQRWALDASTGAMSTNKGSVCLDASSDPPLPTHTATFKASFTGRHTFYIESANEYGSGFGLTLRLYAKEVGSSGSGVTIVDWEDYSNLPDSIIGRAEFKAGATYSVSLQYSGNFADSTRSGAEKYPPVVYVRGPVAADTDSWSLRSRRADFIDYYVVSAPNSIDDALAGYRVLTSAAPLYDQKWYTFTQCKEHYHNQSELLDAAAEFRARKIPVDNIVQDWHYWGNLGWGPHWDPAFYPDPAGMVKTLHDTHFQLMVSVWSKFDTTTSFYKTMEANGQLIPGTNYYDPYNASAREQFYQFSKSAMFEIGVDAIWLDATEPENFPNWDNTYAAGTGEFFMNPYSLMTSHSIHDGLVRDYSDAQGRRPFELTRSSFAGQQRVGACLWSGDIQAVFDVMRRQVAASINYGVSGIPYWSMDTGGFFRPSNQYHSPAYWDLLIRWFQFSAFVPVMRVHGGGSNTELWNYGDYVMDTIVSSAINLRYRMMPYNYALFWVASLPGSAVKSPVTVTNRPIVQRMMAMDFGNDPHTFSLAGQYMWGPSVLVSPIFTPVDPTTNSTSRATYLPATPGGWVHFYTGATISPGSAPMTYTEDVPQTRAALYVKAGSILPLGPVVQYVGEAPMDPIEIRVYPGADTSFVLYEDDGQSTQTASYQFAVIELTWDDSQATLTIGDRSGSFPGMLTNRVFNVVFVKDGHGGGVDPCPAPDATVKYDGTAQKVTMKA